MTELKTPMKILVTGASGFVGKFLIPALLGSGHEVYTLSRREILTHDARLHSIEHDFTSGQLPEELPVTIDCIVHLAASYFHRGFPESALDLFDVNLSSTARLLDYAYKAGAKQFFLGSTGSVYQSSDNEKLREETCIQPTDYFPATKYAAELLANAYSSAMRICIFRLFFPYGPGQEDRLIPAIVQRVKEGKAVDIKGRRGGIRLSPVYIDDLVEIIQEALDQRWEGTYNVASPQMVSLVDIAHAAADILATTPLFNEHGGPEPESFVPDITKLLNRTGKSDFVSFSDGLRKMAALGEL